MSPLPVAGARRRPLPWGFCVGYSGYPQHPHFLPPRDRWGHTLTSSFVQYCLVKEGSSDHRVYKENFPLLSSPFFPILFTTVFYIVYFVIPHPRKSVFQKGGDLGSLLGSVLCPHFLEQGQA